MTPQYLGDMELLTLRKVGFLASRKVNPSSVIPTINWANEVSHNHEIVIVSGFQSTLEHEVLEIALKGTCSIIYVLNRSLYRQIPLNLRPAFNSNRILFISFTSEKAIRPSATNASIRNHYIADIVNALVFASVHELSSLHQLTQTNKTTLLL